MDWRDISEWSWEHAADSMRKLDINSAHEGQSAPLTFKGQVHLMCTWFMSWPNCHQIVGLCSILRKLLPAQERFVANYLNDSYRLKIQPELHAKEKKVNNLGFVSNLKVEPLWNKIKHLYDILHLLHPENLEASTAHFNLILECIQECLDRNEYFTEARHLVVLCLLHPIFTENQKTLLTQALCRLDEKSKGLRNGSCPSVAVSGAPTRAPATPTADPCSTGNTSLNAVKGAMSPQSSGSEGSFTGTGLAVHSGSPLKKSSFSEKGSGMRDVPAWLKTLRLHKYAYLFEKMSYEEMLRVTETQLEHWGVTKGARHKLATSIVRLNWRGNTLLFLEKELQHFGAQKVDACLIELRNILCTPIKAGSDLPELITKLLGKVTSHLMLESSIEHDVLRRYFWVVDKCTWHEAFDALSKRKILSWKQRFKVSGFQRNQAKFPMNQPTAQRSVCGRVFGCESWDPGSQLPMQEGVLGFPAHGAHGFSPHPGVDQDKDNPVQRTKSAPMTRHTTPMYTPFQRPRTSEFNANLGMDAGPITKVFET